MRTYIFRSLALLAAVLFLTACAASSQEKARDPAEGIDPSAVAQDVFTLSDDRDMGYAVVKLMNDGVEEKRLTEAARHLTVNDLLASLRQQAAEASIVQSSPAGWVIDARDLFLEERVYKTVRIVIQRERVPIKGTVVSLAKMTRLILDGKESSVALGWAVYRNALRLAVQK